MLFRFDANQEYQLQAIAADVNLFEGQMRVGKYSEFGLGYWVGRGAVAQDCRRVILARQPADG